MGTLIWSVRARKVSGSYKGAAGAYYNRPHIVHIVKIVFEISHKVHKNIVFNFS